MKHKFLKIENPCSEKWADMEPNNQGRFCEQCSKSVVDLTTMSSKEIAEVVKQSGNGLCGRIRPDQLKAPLLTDGKGFELSIPRSGAAAGLVLATSLTIGQPVIAQNGNVPTEFVQQPQDIQNSKTNRPNTRSVEPKLMDITVFKGVVKSKDAGHRIENAKITFVSTQKIISTNSLEDGSFSMELPTELIEEDNVIRITYYNVPDPNGGDRGFFYEENDLILSKEEILSDYLIQAEPIVHFLGEVVGYNRDINPIVISNGVRISYRQFKRARFGKKSSCSLENKEYLYFDPEYAMVIYGKKARGGLYILIDKTE